MFRSVENARFSLASATVAIVLFISWPTEREFVIGNLLVRIHFIIVMIRWTGLAPWEFEFPFPGHRFIG